MTDRRELTRLQSKARVLGMSVTLFHTTTDGPIDAVYIGNVGIRDPLTAAKYLRQAVDTRVTRRRHTRRRSL